MLLPRNRYAESCRHPEWDGSAAIPQRRRATAPSDRRPVSTGCAEWLAQSQRLAAMAVAIHLLARSIATVAYRRVTMSSDQLSRFPPTRLGSVGPEGVEQVVQDAHPRCRLPGIQRLGQVDGNRRGQHVVDGVSSIVRHHPHGHITVAIVDESQRCHEAGKVTSADVAVGSALNCGEVEQFGHPRIAQRADSGVQQPLSLSPAAHPMDHRTATRHPAQLRSVTGTQPVTQSRHRRGVEPIGVHIGEQCKRSPSRRRRPRPAVAAAVFGKSVHRSTIEQQHPAYCPGHGQFPRLGEPSNLPHRDAQNGTVAVTV